MLDNKSLSILASSIEKTTPSFSQLIQDILKPVARVTTPSFSELLNLCSVYSTSGAKTTGALASTLIVDKILASSYGATKNYISLSSFWGYIAYKAIIQSKDSDIINEKYKPLLYLLFAGISSGMVVTGKDIFAPKYDTVKIGKAIALITEFFDDNGVVQGLKNAYNNSYSEAVQYVLQNSKPLILNKFISYTAAQQSLEIAKLLFLEKFFPNSFNNKLSMFLAIKDGHGFEKIAKLALINFANQLVNMGHKKLLDHLTNSLQKDISIKVAELAFADANKEIVMKLPKITEIVKQVSNTYEDISKDLSCINQDVFMPLINLAHNQNEIAVVDLLNKFPSFILLKGLIESIFNLNNLSYLKNLIEENIYKECKEQTNEYCEITQQKIGNYTVTVNNTPDQYAYPNIHEITKMGGNEFILEKLRQYINSSESMYIIVEDKTVTSIALNLLKDLIHDLAYVNQIYSLEISSNQIPEIENKLNSLYKIFRINDLPFTIQTSENLEELKSTLEILRQPINNNLKREINENNNLSIRNYHLKKQIEQKEMLIIDKLDFQPNKIYAITGTIGTGKTTFLSDIAECMVNAFSSSGEILYPSCNHEKIPIIFCGTVPFTPPATTLFERLTYRLPKEYRENHKAALTNQALDLFKAFGQNNFSKEQLEQKGNNEKLGLSTGQGKITILISAILYKEFLNKPSLLIIDETLANLDSNTTKSVCEKIQDVFNDSLVLSVDHNAHSNQEFYNEFIDLAHYVPSLGENIVNYDL